MGVECVYLAQELYKLLNLLNTAGFNYFINNLGSAISFSRGTLVRGVS
jgi:hypothetical protein